MSNTVIVHVKLRTSDDFRVQLVSAGDPFGTPALVMVDIAPQVGLAFTDPDVVASLAGKLSDAAELLASTTTMEGGAA